MGVLSSIGSFFQLFVVTLWITEAALFCCTLGHSLKFAEISNVTCDHANFTATITVPKVFEGIIFTEGHFFNPGCRFSSPDITAKHLLISLPLVECGNLIKEENGSIFVYNSFVIQHHPIVQTDSDTMLKASCKLPPEVLREKEFVHGSHPNHFWTDELEAYMGFQFGNEILGHDTPNKLLVGDEFMIAIHVNDGGKNLDFQVENCWAYEGETMSSSKYVLKIYDMLKCKNDWISNFTFSRDTRNISQAVIYASAKAFKFPSSKNVHFTCSVQVCTKTCYRYCDPQPEGSNQWRYKRSPNINRERQRLLKATIKALGKKLMESNRRTLSENDGNFHRRSRGDDHSNLLNYEELEDHSDSTDVINEVYNFNLTNNIVVFTGEEFISKNLERCSSPQAMPNESIPKLRFGVITGSLSFVVFCLILICIGCLLTIRKERKKHQIDNFFLYDLY